METKRLPEASALTEPGATVEVGGRLSAGTVLDVLRSGTLDTDWAAARRHRGRRSRQSGYITWQDADGRGHTLRPDGTEIRAV